MLYLAKDIAPGEETKGEGKVELGGSMTRQVSSDNPR